MGPFSKLKGHSCVELRSFARVAVCVFAIKVYTLLLLYALSRQVGLREGYEPFLFLGEGQTRIQRLDEIKGSFLERLAPYDGQFYLDIAQRGYRVLKKEDPNAARGPGGNYAFFPLYPLLARCARWAGHPAGFAILLFVNVVLSSIAALCLYLLARSIGVPAWPSVLFLLTFPTAVFQCVLYTESLFLFLSMGVALCATYGFSRRGAWLGYFAGLCRPQGILLAALWPSSLLRRQISPQAKRASLRPFFAAVAPFAGVLTFSAALWLSIGAPLGFLGIQSRWAREFSVSNLLGEVFSPLNYQGPPFDFLALLLGVALIPSLWRHLPRSLALFGTVSVVFPLLTGTMLSFGRFLSVSFPHFLCLAKVFEGWRFARVVLLGCFIVLQCLIAKGLVGWYFVG